MVSMKRVLIVLCVALMVSACTREEPAPWNGSKLSQPRDQITVKQLQENKSLPLMDMSYFAKPV
jgi:PBP1b-binding outer membrane lipoprotein LpoB